MSRDDRKIIREATHRSLEQVTRRLFFKESFLGMGGLALGSLLGGCNWLGAKDGTADVFNSANPLLARAPHFPAKAKSVIYLHMAGAPSQLELFDYKPDLMKLD